MDAKISYRCHPDYLARGGVLFYVNDIPVVPHWGPSFTIPYGMPSPERPSVRETLSLSCEHTKFCCGLLVPSMHFSDGDIVRVVDLSLSIEVLSRGHLEVVLRVYMGNGESFDQQYLLYPKYHVDRVDWGHFIFQPYGTPRTVSPTASPVSTPFSPERSRRGVSFRSPVRLSPEEVTYHAESKYSEMPSFTTIRDRLLKCSDRLEEKGFFPAILKIVLYLESVRMVKSGIPVASFYYWLNAILARLLMMYLDLKNIGESKLQLKDRGLVDDNFLNNLGLFDRGGSFVRDDFEPIYNKLLVILKENLMGLSRQEYVQQYDGCQHLVNHLIYASNDEYEKYLGLLGSV